MSTGVSCCSGTASTLPHRSVDRAGEFSDMWIDLVDLMKVGGDAERSSSSVLNTTTVHRRTRRTAHVPTSIVERQIPAGCGTPVRTAELEGRNLFWSGLPDGENARWN